MVEEIIDFLEIEQIRRQPIGTLPYGLQKRVELGRALAMEPKVLLLDEPMAGMNVEEKEDMARFILDVNEERASPWCSSSTTWASSWTSPSAWPCSISANRRGQSRPDPADPEVIRAYLGEDEGHREEALELEAAGAPAGAS